MSRCFILADTPTLEGRMPDGVHLLWDSQAAADIAPRLASVDAYGRDGTIPVGRPTLGPRELGLTIGVEALTFQQRLDRQDQVVRMLLGHEDAPWCGHIGLLPQGESGPVRVTPYRLKSLTWKENDPRHAVAAVTLELPDPYWRERDPVEGQFTTSSGQVELTQLHGGSGPVGVEWYFPEKVARVRIECAVSGETVEITSAAGVSGWVKGWDSSSDIEAWGRVWPDPHGVYKVDVDITPTSSSGQATYKWKGKRTWV